jgi:hypothetical protein
MLNSYRFNKIHKKAAESFSRFFYVQYLGSLGKKLSALYFDTFCYAKHSLSDEASPSLDTFCNAKHSGRTNGVFKAVG